MTKSENKVIDFPLKRTCAHQSYFPSADAEANQTTASLSNTISLQSIDLCRPLIQRHVIQQRENRYVYVRDNVQSAGHHD